MAQRFQNKGGLPVPTQSEQNAGRLLNKDLRSVQGFTTNVTGAGTFTQNVTLASPGRFLLGVSLIPNSTTQDISDILFTLKINNAILSIEANAQNFNPNFVGSMIYFPLPQVLIGTDTFQLVYVKAAAPAVSITCNVYYIPRIG